MSFIDETMSTARELFDAASKKTSEAVEVQKLRIAILRKKSELTRQFETLGRACYENLRSGEMDEILGQMAETIDLTKEDLADLKARLERVKKVRVCKACGQKNPSGAAFCNGCGLPLKAVVTEPAAEEAEEEPEA